MHNYLKDNCTHKSFAKCPIRRACDSFMFPCADYGVPKKLVFFKFLFSLTLTLCITFTFIEIKIVLNFNMYVYEVCFLLGGRSRQS